MSWDESQHLYSGWLSWEHGDFWYNPEVPPLIKMWDAIPLLHRDIRQPAFTGDVFEREGFVLGQRFLAANGIDQTLIPARIMASLLTVFLATLLFFCAREMFGDKPALFALLLFCLDPNFFGQDYPITSRWYFPAAFLIKSTLPFLILLGLTIAVMLRGRWQRRREIVFLTVPPLFIFLLCTSSDLGIGYRHLFPMFPVLYILIAGCAAYVVSRYPKSIYARGILPVWQFGTTAAARPGLLAYANEAWGGLSKTHLYLSDSNVDWGQQLRSLLK